MVMAGAVHPDRGEGGWQPKYNYLRLSVQENAGERQLLVEIWPRSWDDENKVLPVEFDDAFKFYTQKMGFREAFTVRDQSGRPTLAYVQANRNTFIELQQANENRKAGLNHFVAYDHAVDDVERVGGSEHRCHSTKPYLIAATRRTGIRAYLSASNPPGQ